MVARIATVEAVSCDSEHEAAWLERNLLEDTLPPWNRTAGGQEVPVYIRLDAGPAVPGLSIVHTPLGSARHFGPFLGGHRVRRAVSALHRVLPLGYTGTGLTGAQRDLARTKGVGPDDRDAITAALTAVLRRDPAAITGIKDQLRVRQGRAADALAFELAARLQAEVEALDWITGPQRATLPEPRDFEVYGWAHGVLVRFQIRAGRLRTWTKRTCTGAEADPHLTTSPPDWADFAHRNAVLAARLHHGPHWADDDCRCHP
jgi:excinuclease ABC subunit C